MKTLAIALSSLLAVAAATSFQSASAAEGLSVGDAAPPFELTGSDGKTYRLSELTAERAVVVAWFPKAFTPGCTNECKSFRSDGPQLREFDVAYFTASCDTVDLNRKFAESLKLDYPILCDPQGDVARSYGVVDDSRAVPRRWTFIVGADGKILHIDKQVQTGSHGDDVAAKLAELGVAKKP